MSTNLTYTGAGTVTGTNGLGYHFAFASLKQEHIQVTVVNPSGASTAKTVTTDYTIESYNANGSSNAHIKFLNDTRRGFTNSQSDANSYKVKISRQTPSDPLITYTAGASVTASDLNTSDKQALFLHEENKNNINSLAAGDSDGAIQINGSNIANNSITTNKILDLEVGTSDLANNAVTTAKIADDAVTTDKLANSINTDIAAAAFTTGMIMMFTGSTAPSGWAFCDGSNGTPDLRSRFIVGAGSTYSSGNTGGADTVTLTTSQIPQHNHGINFYTQNHTLTGTVTAISETFEVSGSASGVFSKQSASGQRTPITSDTSGAGQFSFNGTHNHHVIGSTQNTGSGSSVENRPPYYALAFIMKT